jgi:hypothetical protein
LQVFLNEHYPDRVRHAARARSELWMRRPLDPAIFE